jgi:phosphoribosylanthranilate isomerase
MRVKVCGMTQPGQVDELANMGGVAFAGFIFYHKSPRYVLNHMTTAQIKKINNINKVGVFVNTPLDEVMRIVDECRLHMVQLHGDEPPKYCERIADYISVIKAFRLSENDSIEWMMRPYQDVCDMFMFDTLGAGYGGTGKKFDWHIIQDVYMSKPFFLSGGIEPGDEEKLKEFTHESIAKNLFSIDINSKFEISPGVKDLEKVKKFVQELNNNSK